VSTFIRFKIADCPEMSAIGSQLSLCNPSYLRPIICNLLRVKRRRSKYQSRRVDLQPFFDCYQTCEMVNITFNETLICDQHIL